MNAWIRRFHPAPHASSRLLCLPHAGGSASFFRGLARSLAPEVEVLAVQYPGRQDRRAEPPIGNITGLADGVHAALTGWTDLPTAIFGHSMGAAVAFETALRLTGDGVTPLAIFASGRRAPSRHRQEAVHQLDDDGILAELRQLGGTEAEFLDDPEIRQMILPAVRSDYQAIETYHCQPGATVRCPILVMVGADDPKTSLAEARDWDAHTSAQCELKVFPGGHFYLNQHASAVTELVSIRIKAYAGASIRLDKTPSVG
jgi:surfactin synthase thioesterase subunit